MSNIRNDIQNKNIKFHSNKMDDLIDMVINNSNINTYTNFASEKVLNYIKEFNSYFDADEVYDILKELSEYDINTMKFNKYIGFLVCQIYKDFINNDMSIDRNTDFQNFIIPIIINISDNVLKDKIEI